MNFTLEGVGPGNVISYPHRFLAMEIVTHFRKMVSCHALCHAQNNFDYMTNIFFKVWEHCSFLLCYIYYHPFLLDSDCLLCTL